MTPNLPSGTPRSWKSKFQAWLASHLAPLPPVLSREPVSDAQRPVTEQQNIRTRQLMDRICAVNNANVTRDYGSRTEDLTRHHQPTPMTADDLADAKKLLGVRVEEPRRTPEEYALHTCMVAERAGFAPPPQD